MNAALSTDDRATLDKLGAAFINIRSLAGMGLGGSQGISAAKALKAIYEIADAAENLPRSILEPLEDIFPRQRMLSTLDEVMLLGTGGRGCRVHPDHGG